MDVDKRCMGLNDYNSDMRKAGRGGGMNAYRPPASKEAAPGDGGSYYDKVAPRPRSAVLCVSRPFWRLAFIPSFLTVLYFLLWFSLCLLDFSSPSTTTHIGLPLAVAVTGLAFDQSGLVPWGGGSLLSVLTTHCLQAPFPLQPHCPL